MDTVQIIRRSMERSLLLSASARLRTLSADGLAEVEGEFSLDDLARAAAEAIEEMQAEQAAASPKPNERRQRADYCPNTWWP